MIWPTHKRVSPGLSVIKARSVALWHCQDAVTIIEFALVLPLIMTLGLYGIEIAYMASTNMEVSQLALTLADNAARMEQTDNSGIIPSVTEADINSVIKGVTKQGSGVNFTANGRAIISSLEVNAGGSQYIHWQRCQGSYGASSAYGVQGTVLANQTGLGSGSNKIKANVGSAVMFAEVFYQYKGIFGSMFVRPTQFKQEAAFIIRDARNLTAVASSANTTPSVCS